MGKSSKNIDTNQTLGELFSLSPVKNRPIEVSFTAPDLSSQGGLFLMNEYEHHHGFISKLSDCVRDTRSQLLVQHSYYEMFRQRICQTRKDADDSDLLRDDSILKLCSGRLPDEKALSSQPTISRLENIVTDRELYKMGEVFLEEFIRSYEKPPKVIILDCDDSNFNTLVLREVQAYGDQQGTLFNDYYGEYCYTCTTYEVRVCHCLFLKGNRVK